MDMDAARGVLARAEDGLALGYCVKAMRAFLKFHGISFRQFVDEGIEGERLLATNDYHATAVVEQAMRREGLL